MCDTLNGMSIITFWPQTCEARFLDKRIVRGRRFCVFQWKANYLIEVRYQKQLHHFEVWAVVMFTSCSVVKLLFLKDVKALGSSQNDAAYTEAVLGEVSDKFSQSSVSIV